VGRAIPAPATAGEAAAAAVEATSGGGWELDRGLKVDESTLVIIIFSRIYTGYYGEI
jgi:hypothetical protein